MVRGLPRSLGYFHIDPWTNAFDEAPRDVDLRRFSLDVGIGRSNQAVQVAGLDDLGIYQGDMTHAHVCQLLRNVRAASTQTNDQHSGVSEDALGVGPKKALAAEVASISHSLLPKPRAWRRPLKSE